jgi:hypothetical protein
MEVVLFDLSRGLTNYFVSSDFLRNQLRFFGFVSSAGAGAASSFAVGGVSFCGGADSFAAGAAAFFSFGAFSFYCLGYFYSTATTASTHSMKAIEAESLLRWPSLIMRV